MCEYNSRYKKQIKFEVRNLNNVYNNLSFQKNEGIEPSFFNFFLGINCKLLLYLIIKKSLSVEGKFKQLLQLLALLFVSFKDD